MSDEYTIRSIKRILENPALSDEQRKTLKKYDIDSDKNEGLSLRTRANNLFILLKLGSSSKKPFEEMNREDIEKHINSCDVAQNTLNIYKVVIKKFFKWLFQTDDYPDSVKWIKIKNHNHYKLPEDILNINEVKKLIEASDNLRDRAIIALLYDSACRIGEVINLRQKDVKIDQYGAVIVVKGKTGQRRLRLIDSVPYITQYLNNHPNKGDNNPLFVSKKNPDQKLKQQGIQKTISGLSKRVLKRHIHPHLLRHSRLTHLAKEFSESELKIIAGWTGGSRMPQVYIHLSGADIESKILKKAGLIDKEESKKECEILKPLDCPRCKGVNPATAMFCFKCGAALTLKTAMSIEADKSEISTEIMAAILKDPGVLAAITNAMTKNANAD